jgi:putative acetyltransferase
MEIRRERAADRAAIRAVHNTAFGAGGDQDVVEARLVDQLRASRWWLPRFSLVALSDQGLVGHVVASRATLEPVGMPALGLGPLGVIPAWQGRGVGSALMHAVLAAAEARDETLVGLVGDPDFYRRFGFRAAFQYRIQAPDPDWGAAFQVRIFGEPPPAGRFRYAPPFDSLD